MEKLQKEAIQVTKELVVKFIEAGRVSPVNLGEVFRQTYNVVFDTISQPISMENLESSIDVKPIDKPVVKKK